MNERNINLNTLLDVEIEDIHMFDFPRFVDAFVSSAKYANSTPLTEEELDYINLNCYDQIQQLALESIY